MQRQRVKDLYCWELALFSEPSKINTSRRRLADYVQTLHQKACPTCSTIVFLYSTNQIIDLWRCRWRCRRQISNSLSSIQLRNSHFTSWKDRERLRNKEKWKMHVQSVQNYWIFLSVKYANFWLSCHRCHFGCSSFLFTSYNVSRQLPISCFLLSLKNHPFQPNILRPVREFKKANEMEKLSRNTGINWCQLTFLVVYLIRRNCRDT